MGAIIYTFRDSAAPILAQLKKTPLWVVLAICMCALLYDVVESVITYILARQYNPDFKFAKAMGNTFYYSVYRVDTLGRVDRGELVYYINENLV